MAAKDLRPVLIELRQQNWTVDITTQGHYQACPPDKAFSVVHFSNSDDVHAFANTIRDLKKSGFNWPPPSKKDLAVRRRMIMTINAEESLQTELLQEQERAKKLTPRDTQTWVGDAGLEQMAAAAASLQFETEDQRSDRLFKELRDARSWYTLSSDALKDAQRLLLEAQDRVRSCAEGREDAARVLREKKAEFDNHFKIEE